MSTSGVVVVRNRWGQSTCRANVPLLVTAYVSLDNWKIYRSSMVLFKDFFKDPRYCSLGFFIDPREEVFKKEFGRWKGDDKVKTGSL
jgi:hypothetical protein